jgi:transcriptional regulator with XRE-family HTH domain
MTARFRLAEALDIAGMNQRELARRSGVSFVTINRICANHTNGVTLETLDRLAAALGVAPGELIESDLRPRAKRR